MPGSKPVSVSIEPATDGPWNASAAPSAPRVGPEALADAAVPGRDPWQLPVPVGGTGPGPGDDDDDEDGGGGNGGNIDPDDDEGYDDEDDDEDDDEEPLRCASKSD